MHEKVSTFAHKLKLFEFKAILGLKCAKILVNIILMLS